MKKKTLKYFVLKNKECSTPWTSTLFFTEESAKKYFEESVAKNAFAFNWESYEVIPCELSY